MPDALANIGSFFSSDSGGGLLKALEAGMGGAGLIGNILNEKARSDQLGALTNAEKHLPDPTALAKQVAAATAPLNTGLVQGVENQVQGSLASQGLAQAPGIQASVLSQSLAPFEQQNQSTALQLVMQRLGLPLEYASTILAGLPKDTNLAPLLALLQNKGTGTPGATGPTPNLPTLLDIFSGSSGSTTPGIVDTPSGGGGWLGDNTNIDLSSSGVFA